MLLIFFFFIEIHASYLDRGGYLHLHLHNRTNFWHPLPSPSLLPLSTTKKGDKNKKIDQSGSTSSSESRLKKRMSSCSVSDNNLVKITHFPHNIL